MQIKCKLNIKRGETKLVSHFWRTKTWSEEEERRKEEEEEEEEEEEKRRKQKAKKAKKGMETKIFVWFVWIVMSWYEFVDYYMKFLLELGFEVLKSVITC